MFVQQFFIDGLGCASYLVGSESEGVAAIVDPDRDVSQYLQAAKEQGFKITHIIETHLHADHVSGNTDLSRRTGAEIYLHEAAQAGFPHHALHDGDVIELGQVQLKISHTPGHTPESITLLVADTTRAQEPWMALTGDLLFVGDVGRPDLVGSEAARGLAGELYESLFHKILQLDDSVMIYPGHGAGSLCGRSIGSVRSSTLGYERRNNPALAVQDREEFVQAMTTNLPEQPGNFQRIKAANRRGPRPLGDIQPKPLTLQEAIPHFQKGAGLLDTRTKSEYVARHVPGSVHLPAGPQVSNQVGFILSPDQPVVMVVENEAIYQQTVLALARVGYENVVGYLEGGLDAWEAAGYPLVSGDIEDITPQQLNEMLANGSRPVVVDVREPWEYAMGHVPGAVLIPLGQLSARLGELDPSLPVAAICAHGNRSQSAAALLGQKGFTKIYNVLDGTQGWQMAGLPLER